MTIEPGTSVLHYEVSARIGKGGMGEVFRATDTKLGRDVAIKILPEEFTLDDERVARFRREARLLASLSHPHIASIYGVEDVDGVQFLVMELAAGENLSDRIVRGPIPIDEAIEIALQIAQALEVAHDQGIVHRDLKPANVKVDADNQVQVLDFGLAKAFDDEFEEGDVSNSPTMVRAATHQGVILGTAGYMSPEQARGKSVDERADIWAFGVVLWEMITGRRLFTGATMSDTLAAVLKETPDWKLLPPDTPAAVRRLLRRCLARNPRDRLQDIGDARLELVEALSPQLDEPLIESSAPPARSRPWIVGLATLVSLLAGVALGLWWSGGPDEVSVTSGAQLALPFPPDARLASGSFLTAFTFSPDGRSLAYVGVGADGVRRLYVRPLDEDRPRVLPGTEGAEGPFFSPDGEWIAFWSPWKLSKVRASGSGIPQTICDSRDFRGGTWAGNTIVFTPGQGTPLFRVSDNGGKPERLTTMLEGEGGHRFPYALPDGDTILFSARLPSFDADRAMLATISLSSGERKDIGKASIDARVSPSGHLFYVQTGRLNVVPFDLERLEITGPASVLVDDVVVQVNTGAAQFAVGGSGQLAWVPGDLTGDDVRISRVDRTGTSAPIEGWNELTRHPRLSPDARRALMMVIGPDVGGIWVMSTDGSVSRRLPSATGVGAWASNELWIGNAAEGTGWSHLYLDSIDGSTPREVLLAPGDLWDVSPSSVSADGVLAFNYNTPDGSLDAATLQLAEASDWTPLLDGPADEGGVVFSPDGRYIAYVSNRSGQFEVYVTDLPDRSATWQLSTSGGSEVVWRDDGKEIYFRSGNDLVAVPVSLEPRFEPGSPQVLFRGSYEGVLGHPEVPNYDAAPDGSWFLMIESPEVDRSEESLHLAFDWPRMLEQ